LKRVIRLSRDAIPCLPVRLSSQGLLPTLFSHWSDTQSFYPLNQ